MPENFGHQAIGPKNAAAGIDLSNHAVQPACLSEQGGETTLPAFQALGLRDALRPASPTQFLFSSTKTCPRTITHAGHDCCSRLLYTAFSLASPFLFPGTQRQAILLPLPWEMELAKIKSHDGGI